MSGRKIIEGAEEALAVARGEKPAARLTINGHAYVPASGETIAYVVELERQRDALVEALKFYADPSSVKAEGRWEEHYPGGITWTEDGFVFIDTGEKARAALASIESDGEPKG